MAAPPGQGAPRPIAPAPPRQGVHRPIAAALLVALVCVLPLVATPADPAPFSSAPTLSASTSAAPARLAGADIRDLRGPLPDAGLPPFALTFVALAAAGGAGLVWLKLGRRSRVPAPAPAEPACDPAAALDALVFSCHSGALAAELLCLRVADLVRAELAGRSGVAAAPLTTAELLQRLADSQRASDTDVALAGRVLELCDRVKFAGHRPEQAQVEWLLASVRALLTGEGEKAP